jgi:membrane-bound metal-dependent hydrolase YbcI (DUF457 family)
VFVGHALLAFALAVLAADWRGWPRRRALQFGLLAGAFAALPDVDVVYAVATVDVGRLLGIGPATGVDPSAFWAATEAVHRSMTHSLVVAAVAAPAFGLWALRGTAGRERLARALAVGLLAGLVGVAAAASGALGGIVIGVFVVVGLAVATAGRRWNDLSAGYVGLAAGVGLLSHPWGDLVTGEPPGLLYPFEAGLLDGRIVLHADPTVHLLSAFALELAVVWLALLAVVRVSEPSVATLSDPTAVVGATYGIGALVLVPPTIDAAYPFVGSILAVGVACGCLAWYRSDSTTLERGRSMLAGRRSRSSETHTADSTTPVSTASIPNQPADSSTPTASSTSTAIRSDDSATTDSDTSTSTPSADIVHAGLGIVGPAVGGITVALVGYALVYVAILG